MYINMLLEYKKHLSQLENEIDALAKSIEEYRIIQSIPGIGEKIAATIISEIGEIDRFNHPKKLVAFAGIDPSVFESGTFKGILNRITKRGSSRLRHALYMAVKSAIRDCRKKQETATKFYIVRQTLYQRLQRLNELLGEDFMDSYKRQAIEFAITAYDYVSASKSR